MTRETEFIHDTDGEIDGPSKTQRKDEMSELQQLGVDLMQLPDWRLDAIGMEDNLREALREMRRLTSFEARRRQSQYIGKLMRVADPAPFRRAISAYQLSGVRALQEAERWRERLLDDDSALTAWIELHPSTDVQPLRALIRNTRRERAAAQELDPGAAPSKAVGKARFYRELFQYLRAALQRSLEKSQAAG